QNHAISVARDYADIEVVDDVSIYNGTETYFSIQGKTSQGEMIAVIIPEETNTVYVYPMANGISKEEAQAVATENGAGEIEKSVLGYRDAKPIWEV
ncbi:cell wall elongation regulator TseB-like domain-containing protein, partial [Streptococcus suis]